MIRSFVFWINLLIVFGISAQTPDVSKMTKSERDAYFASLRELSAQDHRLMMGQLGIDSLRPGANGSDPNSPNAANYDESKANPYPTLPDPLVLNNGTPVRTATTWWKKRVPEIREIFDREVYGRVPKGIPLVMWKIVETSADTIANVPVVVNKLVGNVSDPSYPNVQVSMDVTLTVPAHTTERVPVVLELSFVFPPWMTPPPVQGPTGKEQIIGRGWAYASLIPTSVQPDNGAELSKGIIGLMLKGQKRKPEDWGALRAWAWGASRVVDYFATDSRIDAKRIAIEGHSRYGKAAAVAMAYDERIAIGYISSSGAGGLKLHRRNYGEIGENVAGAGEYHWMAGNYIKYAGPLTWNDLPVDAHHLIALCAPRPVFIGCGDKGDVWVDPRGMFLAAVHAGPVYKLLQKKDLGTTSFPPIETSLVDGELAFRQHSGGHTPGPNWKYFLDFAARYFHGK